MLVVVPPFLLYLILITYGEASVTAATALTPTTVNIWITILIGWNHADVEAGPIPVQYGM